MSTKITITPETNIEQCVNHILDEKWSMTDLVITGPHFFAEMTMHEYEDERTERFGLSICLPINGTDYQQSERFGRKDQARENLTALVKFLVEN